MQFFQPEHYAAFDPPKPSLNDEFTIAERIQVKEILMKLDSMLWPYIESSGWDLHHHRHINHFVSSERFIYLEDGTPIVNKITAMWLHYGKSQEQLDFLKTLGDFDYRKKDVEDYFNAFYLHTRIQFYIDSEVFRCWLLLATDKSYYDRSEFLRRIAKISTDRNKFYQLVVPLWDKGFYYEIEDKKLPLVKGLTQDELIKFVNKDKGGYYSGIFKEYLHGDIKIESSNIANEMITNLKLLYPIYDFMAWRPDN
jgi:hypothetical protein